MRADVVMDGLAVAGYLMLVAGVWLAAGLGWALIVGGGVLLAVGIVGGWVRYR
jgi:hypothetical protein